MSMQKVSVMVPPLRQVPPGALWLANLVAWLFGGDAHVRAGVPAWFEAVRAKLAVDRAARRDARGRDELIALARHYQTSQPEFAKDLFAAASKDHRS
jgi:hypothetical protein